MVTTDGKPQNVAIRARVECEAFAIETSLAGTGVLPGKSMKNNVLVGIDSERDFDIRVDVLHTRQDVVETDRPLERAEQVFDGFQFRDIGVLNFFRRFRDASVGGNLADLEDFRQRLFVEIVEPH